MDLGIKKISTSKDSVAPLEVFLTWTVLTAVASLLIITTMHWGGVIRDMALWLYLVGALLWVCLGTKAILAQLDKKKFGDWLDLSVIAFLFYSCWAYSVTPAQYIARFELLWTFTYASVFLSLRLVLHNRRLALGLLVLILILATISCVFALMNKGQDTHLIWGQARPNYGSRISGTFGCPNHFANFMAMSCCLATAFILYAKTPWVLRIVCLYLIAMFSMGIFYSVSRGGYVAWLSGLIAIGCFILFQRTTSIKIRLSLITVCLGALAAAIYTALNNEFVKSRINATWGGDIRLLLARDAITIWKDHPIFGSGMATFDFIHQRTHDIFIGTRAVHTHNDYLNLLADYGLVGFFLVAVFFIFLIPQLLKRYRKSEREFDLLVTRSALWALAAMAAHSFVDFNFHIPACALTFFTLMALGTSHSNKSSEQTSSAFLPGALLGLLSLILAPTTVWMSLNQRTSLQQSKWKTEELAKQSPKDLENLGDQVWKRDPACTPVLENIGDALRIQTYLADVAFKKSLKSIDPTKTNELLIQREQLGQSALKMYDRAALSNTLYDNVLVKQGIVLNVLDRDMEAYLAYSKAVKNQPKNMFFHYYLGFHFVKVGENDLARMQFETAKSMPAHRNLDKEEREMADKALIYMELIDRIKTLNNP